MSFIGKVNRSAFGAHHLTLALLIGMHCIILSNIPILAYVRCCDSTWQDDA